MDGKERKGALMPVRGKSSFLVAGTNAQGVGLPQAYSLTQEMHSLFSSVISCMTAVPSGKGQARPLGRGANINDWDPRPRCPVATPFSSTPSPQGALHFHFRTFSLQGQVKVQKKCHRQWRFSMMGPHVCPFSGLPAFCLPPCWMPAPLQGLEEASRRLLRDPP